MKYIDADTIEQHVRMLHDEAKENMVKMDTEEYRQYWMGRMGAYSNVLTAIRGFRVTSLHQEQPDVSEELEKEINLAWERLEKDYSPSALDKTIIIVSGLVGEKQFSNLARHFYELGLNARKEE